LFQIGDRARDDAERIDAEREKRDGELRPRRHLAADAHRPLDGAGLHDDTADHAENRGMIRILRRRKPRVFPIDDERVLRQVVGADGEEVDLGRQIGDQLDRGRRLEHGAVA
jgi:hypothetical protein